MLPYFVEFVWQEGFGTEDIDGFVVQPDSISFPVETMEELANSFGKLLYALNENDPNKSNCMEQEIDTMDWDFNFGEQPLFITVFSPLYPANHVRRSENTFIFFQLQNTFERHGIGDKARQTPRVMKILSVIKNEFEEQGYKYPAERSNIPKAHKYLSSRWPGDITAEWWRT